MARKDFKKGGERFVKLSASLLAEWHRLHISCGARALLVELINRYNGSNNGRIYLPTREAATMLFVTRNTVSGYLKELEEAGFIVATKPAQLGVDGKGRAAEWRLTHLSCDSRPPTADYRNSKPRLKKRAPPARKSGQGEEAETGNE